MTLGSQESLQDETPDTENLIIHEENTGNTTNQKKKSKWNRLKGIRVIIVSCIVFAIAVTVALIVDIYIGDHHTGHAAIATDVQKCSDIGLELMKKGGSAVDAAVGALICVGVMNPESSGLGGGGFMLIAAPHHSGEVIDFREVAPQSATVDMFNKSANMAQQGGLSVAVPGELRGMELAHKKYGKLKWSELIEPSIKLARDGYTLSNHTAKVLGIPHVQRKIKKSKQMMDMLMPNGEYLKEGDIIRNPKLADTLAIIAKEGAKALYEGKIAESIVKAVKERNGILSLADLKKYTAILKPGLNSTYQGYQILTVPLPASGPVLISALNILERFNLTKKDQGKNTTYQYLIEAFKFAYAQRTHLGDPSDPHNADVLKFVDKMTSKKNAETIYRKIFANKTFPPSYYSPASDEVKDNGTVHVSVVGPDGEIVSVTSSVNGYFGSYVMTDTGIILNNDMDDFSSPGIDNQFGIPPSKANFIRPGKRPQSSTVPVIVRHKQDPCAFRLAVGGSGGSHIPSAVIQTLINILSFDDTLKDAVERPRVHHQLIPNEVEAEGDKFKSWNQEGVLEYLKQVGHVVNTLDKSRSDVNVAQNYHNILRAHSDSRRGGSGSAMY
ncbi:glutathione hydrolase 1 proenzyme-like [Actinia tenebrosa]|uniref:Glutathione hydrolase 1 proenzyme-like n=1 Tax=Actinia tenebrosa TaxID=6105 RepID=A0A6P8H662_ACTTE|nr:glutathione hydrolase 1 proenzyme-like [Actinia tenebrosa]